MQMREVELMGVSLELLASYLILFIVVTMLVIVTGK